MNNDILEIVMHAQSQTSRRRLLDQGMARAILRRDGLQPADGPNFSETLSEELLSYGFGQIVGALELRRGSDTLDRALVDQLFHEAGDALYAVAKNAASDPINGFYTVIAAAAFHLGGYAARAFSCLPFSTRGLNLSVPERVFSALMRRELVVVRSVATEFIVGEGSRSVLARSASGETLDREAFLQATLSGSYCRALVRFYRALIERNAGHYDTAIEELKALLHVAAEVGAVPIWWTTRLSIELLRDLWGFSLDSQLPRDFPGGGSGWTRLRNRYIENLLFRDHSEIELWPSQVKAVSRVFNDDRNAVIALPTGAGKTRIAELAILKCLAQGRRIFYVTPLRALSAQVERALSRSFAMPDVLISSLYSAIGAQTIDLYALKTANIVVMTPEKLHFAIRLDASVLGDVGLVILDEGHMIGLKTLREIRYEVLVQRLLTRDDAQDRRIICLSAVLPAGDDLRDFADWVSQSDDSAPIAISWRPTQLRFGLADWQGRAARLSFWNADGSEDFFVPRFIREQQVPTPRGRQRRPFPRNRNELVLSGASRYIADGESVLIYAPERRSVETLGKVAVEAVDVNAIIVPFQASSARRAIRVGTEWLGADHVAVGALQRGVALHHGDLPYAFRREIEELFRSGAIKLMISSPTLAQGLNITVATVLFSSIYRSGDLISVQEFVNVCGRAGRPFAAAEGHVIFSAFDTDARRKQRSIRQWRDLLLASRTMSLQSGLVELVVRLLAEMERLGFGTLDQLTDYALNLRGQETEEAARAQLSIDRIDALDEAILGLIGDSTASEEQLAEALDRSLRGSLWQKELARMEQAGAERLGLGLIARASHIWQVTNVNQRKRFYAAGLSLRNGMALEEMLPDLVTLYESLEEAVQARETSLAIQLFVGLAAGLFQVELFRGEQSTPPNWKDVLRRWLGGVSLGASGEASPTELRFVQSVCSYSLVWGIEAVRAFRVEAAELSEPPMSTATPLLEYGVSSTEAMLFMRLGLESRAAAVAVIEQMGARFDDVSSAIAWLSARGDYDSIVWPAPEAREAWFEFSERYSERGSWNPSDFFEEVTWYGASPPDGTVVDVLRSGLYARPRVYADDVETAIGEMERTGRSSFRGFVYGGRVATAQIAE